MAALSRLQLPGCSAQRCGVTPAPASLRSAAPTEPRDSPGGTGPDGTARPGAMAQDREGPPAKRFKAAPPGTQPQSAAPPAHVQRRSLPISAARGPLLARLRRLDTAILIGEWAGLGKAAQKRSGCKSEVW